MLVIAFWNINKQEGSATIAAIVDLALEIVGNLTARSEKADLLLCIAEPGNIDEKAIVAILQQKMPSVQWWGRRAPWKRFALFGTLPEDTVDVNQNEVGHSLPCSLTRTRAAGSEIYHIWFVHLGSPAFSWHPNIVTTDEARFLRENIETREDITKPTGTLAIGDFNMEPFNEGMISTTGLNASPCRTISSKLYRSRRPGEMIQYFYNPMWELLGSWLPTRQPGTFYRRENTHAAEWHIIDHVLVRPSLMRLLQDGTPVIVTKAGATSFTTNEGGISSISDHLPIFVGINI